MNELAKELVLLLKGLRLIIYVLSLTIKRIRYFFKPYNIFFSNSEAVMLYNVINRDFIHTEMKKLLWLLQGEISCWSGGIMKAKWDLLGWANVWGSWVQAPPVLIIWNYKFKYIITVAVKAAYCDHFVDYFKWKFIMIW